MSHSHTPGHNHAPRRRNERRLAGAAVLIGLFMLVEVIGGLVSGSLALLADAGHMLTDFAGLLLAWIGFRLARRPADSRRSYGFDRFSVLAAFVNGLALFAIAAVIVFEAVRRLSEPTEILGGLMFWVAVAGLAVNIAAFLVLHGADRSNLNLRAAFIHVVGDLLGSAAAIAAALVVIFTGWTPIDPLLSVLVAAIILRSAWQVVAESGHILLEGVPADVETGAIAADLRDNLPFVEDIHHVHAWSISQERPMVTLHARVTDGTDTQSAVLAIKRRLAERFDIEHATVEIEHGPCADDTIAAMGGQG